MRQKKLKLRNRTIGTGTGNHKQHEGKEITILFKFEENKKFLKWPFKVFSFF